MPETPPVETRQSRLEQVKYEVEQKILPEVRAITMMLNAQSSAPKKKNPAKKKQTKV